MNGRYCKWSFNILWVHNIILLLAKQDCEHYVQKKMITLHMYDSFQLYLLTD